MANKDNFTITYFESSIYKKTKSDILINFKIRYLLFFSQVIKVFSLNKVKINYRIDKFYICKF